jgi:proteasome lid subunit RPN8/RPN11
MEPRIVHRFVAELRLDGGGVLTTPALDVDWAPALAWQRLQQLRRGGADAAAQASMQVRPRWDRSSGPPSVTAIELVAHGTPATGAHPIPTEYFADAVRRAVAALVAEGRVEDGATYTWRLFAFETTATRGADESRDRRGVADHGESTFSVAEAPPTQDAPATCRLPDLLRSSARRGPARAGAANDDLFLVVAQHVLDEADAVAKAAGEVEAGGVLLGRLARDAAGGDLVVEVTAQVPAHEAVADDTSLRFTPRTWHAVHAAVALRKAGERPIGWWHSHPRNVWPCRDCAPERRAHCPSNRAFFSSMDVAFHRAAFPGAENVALLLSFHEAADPRHDLFGWRQGLVSPRDYHVMEDRR